MKKADILKVIRDLSFSQGCYSRLYSQLMYVAKNDPVAFNECMEELEGKNFAGPVDLILYLEG